MDEDDGDVVVGEAEHAADVALEEAEEEDCCRCFCCRCSFSC